MVKTKENLIGKRFNRLVVLRQVEDYISPKGKHYSKWECQCDCGNITITTMNSLKAGYNQSCGCLQKDKAKIIGNNNKKYNKYDLSGNYGIGWTTNTDKEFYFDLEDYNKIKDYCWIENSNGYICSTLYNQEKNKIYLHKIITDFEMVDHKNRNKLDNQKSNLRKATPSENQYNRSIPKNNTSGFIGVFFDKTRGKWIAQIVKNKERIYLGGFENKKDAVKARLQGELKYFGKDFAPQRDLFKKYDII